MFTFQHSQTLSRAASTVTYSMNYITLLMVTCLACVLLWHFEPHGFCWSYEFKTNINQNIRNMWVGSFHSQHLSFASASPKNIFRKYIVCTLCTQSSDCMHIDEKMNIMLFKQNRNIERWIVRNRLFPVQWLQDIVNISSAIFNQFSK